MRVLFAIEIIALMVLYMLSKGKYDAYIKTPEGKEYGLPQMMPMTMLLLDLADYRFSGKYDRRIMKLISGLHGSKSVGLHIKLFYSNKLAFMFLALTLLTFFGVLAKEIDYTYIGFTIMTPLLTFYLFDKDLENRLQRKYSLIRADFPDMVSKLVLLVNAGMTINRAWEKICIDTKKDTPLYKELKITHQQIQAGKSESEAYEDFAKRCRVREITKFITLIIQNLKKGTGDLVPLLKLQADECWEMRKSRAKQLGDEASSKLIIPMMIMFIGILIIVILPAVLQLSSL